MMASLLDADDMYSLLAAAEAGDVDKVKTLLELKNRYYSWRLQVAAKAGDVDEIKTLLQQGKYYFDYLVRASLKAEAKAGDMDQARTMLQQDRYTVKYHTLLHYACQNGHLNVVRMLASEFKANLNIRSDAGCTPLMLAARNGHDDVVFALLRDYQCSVTDRDNDGLGVLHHACAGGSEDVVLALLRDYQCPVTDRDKNGWGVLHHACARGSVMIVQTLIQEHKADVSALNSKQETPLDVALKHQKTDVVLCLVFKFGCDSNVAYMFDDTPLHYACELGDVELVQSLLLRKADVNAYSENIVDYYRTDYRDERSQPVGTPLHVAFRTGKYEVLLSLISDPSLDPYVKDHNGQTYLHLACKRGNIDVVNALLHTHKMDVNALNEDKETALHVAVASNHHKVALALVKEHGCDITTLDRNGWTVLHAACQHGAIDLVHALIYDMTDINVRTSKNDTPLHMASRGGHYDVVLALVSDARCDPSAQGYLKRTALHIAAYQGYHKIVQRLLKFTSPLVVDELGNTPLHLASENFRVDTVQCLLHDNAPVLFRNANGKTPRDVAQGGCGRVLKEYIQGNRKQLRDHYNTILRLADKKYSGSHWITRIFVIGNPGAGKSSFVGSLKREGFFESFSKVSESTVPPHTAGIIPSVHMSSQYGRVLFYDFAGDVEYYSSHAAIFESLASSRKGSNIFIIVVDLREDSNTIKTTLHYWFSFIQYQRFSRSSFIVVGGHLDQSVEQSWCLDEFCTAVQPNVHNIKHFTLDCRDPRSSQIAQVKKQIFMWVRKSQKYELSREAKLLLGLLEKDFSAVTACPVQTLVSHIKDCGGWLPVEPKPLHQILLELHEVGVLLLLGDYTNVSYHVILNISQLTNEVHELLFATSSFSNIQESENFNIGILPDSILKDVLPQYVTKECLTHLQYCQELRHTDVALFPSLKLTDSTSQSFLFFPALCSADKGEVPWDESTGHSFSIGWLALCTDVHDYFPPRFLHVLLLRLVHRFTLSIPAQLQTAHASLEHSRRCTMWKKGVYWKMEEGVDCVVELVKKNKGVVVLSKSSQDGAEDCVRVFTKVVSCVMEAKAEFCHFTKPKFFLLDSSAEADYLNKDHQFAMSDVKRALESPKSKRVIVSVSGKGHLELAKLHWMQNLTLWFSLFPFELNQVLPILRDIIRNFMEFGLRLGAEYNFLDSLKVNFPDSDQRWTEVWRWWMKNSPSPPCYYTLVEYLEDIERQALADKLRGQHSLHIQLQEMMLSEETQALKPDEEFLRSLSGVVGSRWPTLAVHLATLTEKKIEKLKGKVGLHPEQLALQVLKIWASKEGATYGQLCHQFKTVLFFE